jgi:hypothetical protein
MPAKHIAKSKHVYRRQGGAALLVLLVIMVVALAAVLLKSLSSSALNTARQENTSAALAQAKDALLGRAVSDDTMPGSLPCPDTNDDGSAELLSGNDCPSYIGRLPWRTLDLPDLRDGSGERLWYALSPAFRDDNSAEPLNSNTKGTLLVYGADGATLQTQAGYSAVAVIFSPGSPLVTQTRSTVAQQNNAANYLDIANSRNNATASGPFIAGAKSNTFNDQLLYITTRDLMPLVEQRVAGYVKNALANFSGNNKYPWADSVSATADYHSDIGLNRGWLPDDAATGGTSPTPDWPAGSFPQWFFDNQWYSLIYYSVAKNYTYSTLLCTSCVNNTLGVDAPTNTGVRVLFFMPGTPIGTMTRAVDQLSDYLEDSQNNDDANDYYVTPTSQGTDRDRLYWMSSTRIWNK